MPELALYRRYRPHNLETVVGQEHITTTLKHALANDSPAHAYLFTGPHGVGKTSIARILAHEINKLPYSNETHLDIIEIDAASNRRIDEIRELRDKIHVAPTSAPFKVYIIDEVHMLTKEAFNALLKTLEEPPSHAVFILATTEAHKLPETIVSRTQRFAFRPVSVESLTAHLNEIAQQEKFELENAASEMIAEHANGSVRDAVAMLDQLSNSGQKITTNAVEDTLGLAPSELVNTLLAAVMSGEIDAVSSTLNTLTQQGVGPTTLAQQLIRQLRSQSPDQRSLDLIDVLLDVFNSKHQRIRLETTLIKAALSAQPDSAATAPKHAAAPARKEQKTQKESPVTPQPQEARVEPPAQEAVEKAPVESPIADPVDFTDFDAQAWKHLLAKIKEHNNSLYAVLRMAEPQMDEQNSELHLKFKFPFHQKRFSEEKNKRQAEVIVKELVGKPIKVVAVHDPETKESKEVFVRNGVSQDVENVIDMMGGGEVVEL